jgi:hypothetical protein
MDEITSFILSNDFVSHVLAGLFCKMIEVTYHKTKGFIKNKEIIDRVRVIIEKTFDELMAERSDIKSDYATFVEVFKHESILVELQKFNAGHPIDSRIIIRELQDSDFLNIESDADKFQKISIVWNRFLVIFYSKIAEDSYLSRYLLLRTSELLASKSIETINIVSDIMCQTHGIHEKIDWVIGRMAREVPDLVLINREFIDGRLSEANPEFFYKGNTSWANIFAEFDISRDVLLNKKVVGREVLTNEIVNSKNEPGVGLWLITAPAGEGKTALLFRLGYELFKIWEIEATKSFHVLFLQGVIADFKKIEYFYSIAEKPLFILVDCYNPKRFIENLEEIVPNIANMGYNVKFLVAARKNEWDFAGGAGGFAHRLSSIREIELCKLSDDEIRNIVVLLDKYQCLGEISKYVTMDEKVAYVKKYSAKWLLVALMEATKGQSFEKIIENEYRNLPPEIQRLYLLTCFFNTLRMNLPLFVIERLSLSKLLSRLPKGVLFILERNLVPISLKARHPLIAEKVVEQSLDQRNKIQLIKEIFDCINAIDKDERLFTCSIMEEMILGPNDPVKSNRKKEDIIVCKYFLGGEGSVKLAPIIQSAISEMGSTRILDEVKRWDHLYFCVGDINGNKMLIEEMLKISKYHPYLNFLYGKVLERESISSKNIPDYGVIENHLWIADQMGLSIETFFIYYSAVKTKLGNKFSAVTLLKRGITLYPESDLLNIYFGKLIDSYKRRGAYAELAEVLKKALKIDNHNRKTLFTLIQALRAGGMLEQALLECSRLISIKPVEAESWNLYAACLADFKKDYPEAIGIARRILLDYDKRDIFAAKLRNNLAIWLDKLNRGDPECEILWKEAIEIAPQFPWPHILLGDYLFTYRDDSVSSKSFVEAGLKYAEGAKLQKAIEDAKRILEKINYHE